VLRIEVKKVLNNNVVVAFNESNEEVILMGNGLGFRIKAGATISDSKVEKVFELKSKAEIEQMVHLISDIPEEVLHISYEISLYAQEKLEKKFNETSFISIADHLHSSIQRNKKNIQVKNFLLWDIKRFFPLELKIARIAIKKINQQMSVDLNDDEAGFLALHITNAEIDNNNNEDAISLTMLMEEILTVVKYTLKVDFSENDIYFQRFITHLKFFSEQVLKKIIRKK
jgi:beta-glucoside operon transcriptional antiterminator